jgi:ubiquinone/menaquinone biosynthesis C-methylase UbiE
MAERVCPWWMGYLLISPFRQLYQNPEEILAPYVKKHMMVLEIGPGMGYFTLPMARMVGEDGRIICVDVQKRMLKSLIRRAKRARLADRITTVVASAISLRIDAFADKVDFVLAFAVVHEVPDQENLFREIYRTMKDGAPLLISEPTGHTTPESFAEMLDITRRQGFDIVSTPSIRGGKNVLLRKVEIGGKPR